MSYTLPRFMSSPPDKSVLRAAIVAQLQAELHLQSTAAELAHDEAISEESRAENKYDTHSQEAAYLAEGQAKLAAEIAESVAIYQNLTLPDFPEGSPIALGALVELEAKERSSWYFLGPRAGGMELPGPDGSDVLVITPQSPLGRQLLGLSSGAAVASPGRGGVQTVGRVL